ncbi:hypothetical protein PQX77_015745 [Marasmius sp. AFHP31]|nr:hypothetical protein PQX77_015745 [Marasmius sp. AFHP31]
MKIHPPFKKAIIRPMGLSHCAKQLDKLCTGNREAYFALFLQFYILCSQEDPFLRNTAMCLDPLQDFLYLAPQTDKSTFCDILDAQIGPYAQAIAEIGVLISTTLIPGALRAWVDAVFNAIPVLTPREAVPVRMFFFNPADTIERMTRPYTSLLSETNSSPNLSGLNVTISLKHVENSPDRKKFWHLHIATPEASTQPGLPEYSSPVQVLH